MLELNNKQETFADLTEFARLAVLSNKYVDVCATRIESMLNSDVARESMESYQNFKMLLSMYEGEYASRKGAFLASRQLVILPRVEGVTANVYYKYHPEYDQYLYHCTTVGQASTKPLRTIDLIKDLLIDVERSTLGIPRGINANVVRDLGGPLSSSDAPPILKVSGVIAISHRGSSADDLTGLRNVECDLLEWLNDPKTAIKSNTRPTFIAYNLSAKEGSLSLNEISIKVSKLKEVTPSLSYTVLQELSILNFLKFNTVTALDFTRLGKTQPKSVLINNVGVLKCNAIQVKPNYMWVATSIYKEGVAPTITMPLDGLAKVKNFTVRKVAIQFNLPESKARRLVKSGLITAGRNPATRSVAKVIEGMNAKVDLDTAREAYNVLTDIESVIT